MKKNYALLIFFMTVISYGQTPVITAIIDGDCTGGTPKLMEIFAQGTVDFTMYSVENQTNANTTWGSTTDLSSFGTITNGFVYVVTSTSAAAFESEFPTATTAPLLVSGVINVNGDDRIRIIETATSTVIDQYGVDGEDGTDTAWEYRDSYARRVNGTVPDGTFTATNWLIPGISKFDGLGVCQDGTETFETIMGGIGNYDTVLSNSTFKTLKINIYPNPVKDILTIQTKLNDTVKVSVYDLLGKKVMSKTLNGKQLNVSNLKRGIYLLNLSQNNKVFTKKLVVE